MGDMRQARTNRDPIYVSADSLTFGLYDSSEVRSLSTVRVFNPVAFNQLGHPLEGGLYDLRMGPYTDRDQMSCTTCHLTMEHCPGHLGHIELPLPVVNSLFYNIILRLLKITCVHCHQFKMPDYQKTLFLIQMKFLEMGDMTTAQEAAEIAERKEEKKEKKKRGKSEVNQCEEEATNIKLKEFAERKMAEAREFTEKPGTATTRSLEQLRKEYCRRLMGQGKSTTTCPHCGAVTRKINLYKSRFIYDGMKMTDTGEEDFEPSLAGNKSKRWGEKCEKNELNPKVLQDHFRVLFSKDHEILTNLFPVMRNKRLHPTDGLFLDVIAVPPPRVRPCQFTGGIMTQHPQSQALQNVLQAVAMIRPLVEIIQGKDISEMNQETQDMIKTLRGENTASRLDSVWKELQTHVDHVIDRWSLGLSSRVVIISLFAGI